MSRLSHMRKRTRRFEFSEHAEIVDSGQPIPQEPLPKRIREQIVTQTCHEWQEQTILDSQNHSTRCEHECSASPEQVEVETLNNKTTMQGEKVGPVDDQSSKDQSGDSVLSGSRSSEFRKSHSKCRTRNDQPKIHLKTGSSSDPVNKL